MAFEGDLTNLGLADIFQTLGMNRQSGTLVVKKSDVERRFFFSDEGVSLLSSRSARRFMLGNLLVGMGKLGEPDLRVAIMKQERAKDQKLGDLLIQTEMVQQSDIDDACRYQAAEELYETFNWKSGKFQFLEGANAGPSGGPGPFAEFHFDVTDIVMEAARRADEYAANLDRIGDQDEFWIRKDPEGADEAVTGRTALLLHNMLDGTRNVQQVLDDFYLSYFDTSEAFVVLLNNDLIRPMTSADLRSGAQRFLDDQQYEKAIPVLLRAAHHDPNDASLLESLATAEEESGQRKEASETRTREAEILRDAGQSIEAIAALHKAVDLDARNRVAYEHLMDIHAALEQFDKAEDACREAARLLSDDRDFDGALGLLARGLKLVPESVPLRVQHANCLLALGRNEEGQAELEAVAETLEDRKETGTLLLGVYRKLVQLDPERKDIKDRIEDIQKGEKARETRKRMVKVGGAVGVIAVLAIGWMLRPMSLAERLDEVATRLRTEGEAAWPDLHKELDDALEAASEGSDERMTAQRLLGELELLETAEVRAQRVEGLWEAIQAEVLAPAAEDIAAERYIEGVKRLIPLSRRLTGTSIPAELRGKAELNKLTSDAQTEMRRIILIPDRVLRERWVDLQSTLTSVEAVDIQRADETKQHEVFETSQSALETLRAVDWTGLVDAFAAVKEQNGDIDGLHIPELRAIVNEMQASLQLLEDKYNRARAMVMRHDLRNGYSASREALREAKQRGKIDDAIAVCDEFLEKCLRLRKEEPKEIFAPVIDSLFGTLKLDAEIKAERDRLARAREGLQFARQAEQAGDLQRAFDLYVKTIKEADDIDFKSLARLPLRILSRPEGAKVWVTLPGVDPIEAGMTPTPDGTRENEKVLGYPYQGTTVIRVELDGFEPAILERRGIAGDTEAVVTVDLQRTMRWRVESGAAVEGAPAIAPGTVYVANRAGLLRALDAKTGDERFQLDSGHRSGISGGVTVKDNRAWLGGIDREAFCADLSTGKWAWRKPVQARIDSRPLLTGGIVVFADEAGNVYGFDPTTGDARWTRPLGATIASDVVAAGGRIVVGLANGKVVGLDPADGAPAWEVALGGPVYGRFGVSPDGSSVAVGTEAATVARVDAVAGRLLWTHRLGETAEDEEESGVVKDTATGVVRARPAVTTAGVTVVTTTGVLWHLDGADGHSTGSTELGFLVKGGSALDGDTFYIAASGGRLVAYDLARRAVAWTLAGLGQLEGPPEIGYGTLVVATADGRGAVIALEP